MSSGKERFQFSERLRPVADRLYRMIVPTITEITRFDKDLKRHILDQEYAIDLQFILANGMKMTGQEKFREFDKRREEKGLLQYSDVTIELYNDPILKIKGDWFNLCSQFYFVGFASKNEQCFERYVFLDWLKIIMETQNGNIHWETLNQSDGKAKASFRYTPFMKLPNSCILAMKE